MENLMNVGVSIPQAVSTVATKECGAKLDFRFVSIPQAVSTVATFNTCRNFYISCIVSIPQAVSTVAT